MRKIALVTAAAVLGVAAPAAALSVSTATPNKAGKPSSLHFDIDGLAAPIGGRIPLTLQLTAPRGFQINLQAVAQHCGQEAAKLNECPAGSRFGKGALVIGVTTPQGVRTVTIPLNVYLHSNSKVLAIAKVFGWQVVPATIDARHGLVVRFNPLPQGPPFPGVTYALKRITLDFGATRMVSQRTGKKVKKTRVSLIRNPMRCAGSWASSALLTFKVGPAAPLSTPTTCAKS
jgi:hypothetical protein